MIGMLQSAATGVGSGAAGQRQANGPTDATAGLHNGYTSVVPTSSSGGPNSLGAMAGLNGIGPSQSGYDNKWQNK